MSQSAGPTTSRGKAALAAVNAQRPALTRRESAPSGAVATNERPPAVRRNTAPPVLPSRIEAQNAAYEKAGKFDLRSKLMAGVDIAWAIVGGATFGHLPESPGIEKIGLWGTINNGMDATSSAYSVTRKTGLPANPLFSDDELKTATEDSSTTKEYLDNRKRKSLGGDLIGAGGAAGSVVTHGVNVGSGSRHLNSSVTTFIHLVKLRRLSKSLPQDDNTQLSEWCDSVIKMKQYKLSGRTLKLGGSVIPAGQMLGSAIGGAASTVLGLGMSTRSKWHHGKDCYAAAAGLHAAAFRESGLPPGDKYATRIVRELFRRRGLTRIYGTYNVDKIIQEQAGWMAIGDKIFSA